ncbi:MAG: fumarylacetoacetate hydrolase family protein [Desulfomicrobium escambiense]|nr:fumarylacetoacetate hydrolase family protein [Desulfomicrobium escambiense]
MPIADVRILPPVLPTKIIGIGRNYRDHAKELDNPLPEEPLVFLKPPTALIGTLDAVVMPRASGARRLRGRGRRRHPEEGPPAPRRRPGRRRHPRLYLLQRRHRPGPPGQGRPVHPGQGLRHLRRRRALHRDGARSGRPAPEDLPQRQARPVRDDGQPHLLRSPISSASCPGS